MCNYKGKIVERGFIYNLKLKKIEAHTEIICKTCGSIKTIKDKEEKLEILERILNPKYMNAEQYLKRIENGKISSGDNYTRKELIAFAEKYAKQLRLCGVGAME